MPETDLLEPLISATEEADAEIAHTAAAQMPQRMLPEASTGVLVDESSKLTKEEIAHMLEGLCTEHQPRSIAHGLFLLGLGSLIKQIVLLMGLLSMFGSMVTFLTIYTAAPARPTDFECFRHDSKHHPEDLYEHQTEAKVNTSIANEWKLYCEDEWKLELIGSLFFLGGFVGVGLGGFLSDKYGRRTATLALFVTTCISVSASVLAPTWEIFAALRFITGISCNGMYLTAFTLLTEWVPDGWRAMVGTGAYTCLFAGGEVALAGMAFMLEGHSWQVLTTVLATWSWVLFPILMWGLPESPSWLLVNGRADEAEAELNRAWMGTWSSRKHGPELPPGGYRALAASTLQSFNRQHAVRQAFAFASAPRGGEPADAESASAERGAHTLHARPFTRSAHHHDDEAHATQNAHQTAYKELLFKRMKDDPTYGGAIGTTDDPDSLPSPTDGPDDVTCMADADEAADSSTLTHPEGEFLFPKGDSAKRGEWEPNCILNSVGQCLGGADKTAMMGALSKTSTYTMMLMWFTAALTYYGLTLSSGSLAGSLYVNASLSAAMELPAALAALVLMERLKGGRRTACFMFYFMGGVACLLSGMTSHKGLSRGLNMLGKFNLTAAFDTIYIFSSEMFETSIKNRVMGMCSAAGRIGSLIAPDMVVIGTVTHLDPGVIFGVASLVTALVIITTLPGPRAGIASL